MEWSVELNEEDGYVEVQTRGRFTAEGHARMVEDVLAQSYWRPGMSALFDHRSMDMSAANYALMRQASDTHARHQERIGDGRAAIVVKSESDYGSVRQFENLLGDKSTTQARVFKDIDEARAWVREG